MAASSVMPALSQVQIGLGNHVPVWELNTELEYDVCDETFPERHWARFTASQLAKAISKWENVGVSFQRVSRGSGATFRVVYKKLPKDGKEDVLAEAFFPNAGDPNSRTLYIYALAFAKQHVKNQANILAHEIGHILGLRHEFAPEEEAFCSSVTLRGRNPTSVMNYYPESSQLIVRQQDLDGLRALYDPSKTQFGGKPVRRFKAVNFKYPLIRE